MNTVCGPYGSAHLCRSILDCVYVAFSTMHPVGRNDDLMGHAVIVGGILFLLATALPDPAGVNAHSIQMPPVDSNTEELYQLVVLCSENVGDLQNAPKSFEGIGFHQLWKSDSGRQTKLSKGDLSVTLGASSGYVIDEGKFEFPPNNINFCRISKTIGTYQGYLNIEKFMSAAFKAEWRDDTGLRVIDIGDEIVLQISTLTSQYKTDLTVTQIK